MASRVKYKIEVYNVTAASGYKESSGVLGTGGVVGRDDDTGNDIALTDANCSDYFIANKYPDPLPSGTNSLTAEDLSAVFNKKTFGDVNAAKTAIISSDLATAIAENCSSINYTLVSNNLILDCYHADSTKESNMAAAMDASGWSSEAGAVYSTLT